MTPGEGTTATATTKTAAAVMDLELYSEHTTAIRIALAVKFDKATGIGRAGHRVGIFNG